MRLACVWLVFSSFALAQTPPVANPRPAKVQKIDFGDSETIEGTLQHPQGTLIVEPPPRKFGSMIRVRADFNDKLRESVHEM